MKRLLRKNFGGTIDETIGAIFGIGLTLLTFWGIGWSFYRHGTTQGAIAASFHLTHGIEALLRSGTSHSGRSNTTSEPSKLQFSSRIALPRIPTGRCNRVSMKGQSRSGLGTLHRAERQKLKEACRNFGIAAMDYSQRYIFAMLDGDTSAHPEQALSVQQHIAGFRSVKGFDTEWQHLLQDTASLNDVSASLKRGNNDSSLRVGDNDTPDDRTKTENTIRATMQVMSDKVQRTIDELFNPS